jgi:hypothetical protein
MKPIPLVAMLFVPAVALVACSSTSSGGGGTTGPQQACLDTADAVAKAAQRCGGDYQANYDAFVKCSANSDCKNITSVNNESSLRGTCIPSFSSISCPNLAAGNVDASCKAQLVHLPFQPPAGCPTP